MVEQPGISVFTPPKASFQNSAPAQPVRTSAPVQPATSPVVTSSPLQSEPEKRWASMRSAAIEGDPWQADPARTMMVKDVDGTVRAVPRTDGGVNGVPQPEGQPQPQPGPAAVDTDGRLAIGDLRLSETDIRGLLERKGIEDSRRAQMPKDAASFGLDLPSDFEMPPGVAEWQWNLQDPVSAAMLGQAKEFAFAHGLDQPAFSKLLGLYVSNQIAEGQRFEAAKAAEVGKLGSNERRSPRPIADSQGVRAAGARRLGTIGCGRPVGQSSGSTGFKREPARSRRRPLRLPARRAPRLGRREPAF
jgi:hypothetical protein